MINSTMPESLPGYSYSTPTSSKETHGPLDLLDLVEQMDCINVDFYLKVQIDDKTSRMEIRLLFGFIYGAIFVFGLLGNGGVIAAVAKNPKLQNARNIFLLSLMASDLLLCFTAVPVTPFAAIKKEWIFGHFLCKLVPLSQSASVLITSWTLTAIALDKYVHIRHVTKGPINLSQALLIISCIWVLSCSVNVPYMLSYSLIDGSFYGPLFNNTDKHFCGVFCDEIFWISDTARMVYGTSIMALQFVFPLIIISFCYIQILAIVGRDMIVENVHFACSLTAAQRIEAVRRKRRVNYILIAMVATFISAWFPLNLVNILRDFAHLPGFILEQRYLWALVVHSVAMTTVCWNPVLFFWLTRKRKTPETKRSLMEGSVQLMRPLNFILNKIRGACAPDDSSLVVAPRPRLISHYIDQSTCHNLTTSAWRQVDPAPSPTWEAPGLIGRPKATKSWSFHFSGSENGLVQRSNSQTARSASAQPFEPWIFEETLPLISMSNGYIINSNSITVSADVENDDFMDSNKLDAHAQEKTKGDVKKTGRERRKVLNNFLLKNTNTEDSKCDGFQPKNDSLVFLRLEKSSTV